MGHKSPIEREVARMDEDTVLKTAGRETGL